MSTTNINYLSLPSMLGQAGYWCGRNSECPQITHCYKYATTILFHINLLSINITGIELWLQQWEVGALFIALLGHHRLFLSISYINVWFNILDKSEYMFSIYYRIRTISMKPSEFHTIKIKTRNLKLVMFFHLQVLHAFLKLFFVNSVGILHNL